MANTEQIEAKLCAYVDGELDAAGRAEIEQHLAGNPQHRQLLDELIAQRELLRTLPREKAPEDLFDSFQTQLERSVLLDLKQPAGHVAGRINPWPQVFSIAAVLLLAVGLFAVIYFVLPSERRRSPTYAIHSTTTAPAREAAAETLPAPIAAPAGGAGADESATRRMAEKGAVAVAPTAPPPSIVPPTAMNTAPPDIFTSTIAGEKSFKSEAATPTALAGLFEPPPLEPAIERQVKDSPHVPQNSMLLVVCSSDPTSADRQVTQYLAQNNIRWDDVTEPMPPPLAMKTLDAYPSKMQQKRSYELRATEPRPMGKGDAPGAKKDSDRDRADAASEAGPSQPAPSQSAAPPQPPAAASAEPEAITPAPAAPAPTATPEPAPAPAPVAIVAQRKEQQQAQQAQVPRPAASQPADEALQDVFAAQQRQQFDALTQQNAGQLGVANQRLIVARGLTRTQVAELNSSIIAQNTGRLSNYYRSGSVITPTTPPLAAPPIAAAVASTQAEQRARRAMEDKAKEGVSAAATGGLMILNGPPTTVATTQPLEEMKRQKLAVDVPATQPAGTQPVTGSLASRGVDLGGGLAVATRSIATTMPPEERMDVVIVVTPQLTAQAVQLAAPPAAAAPPTVPAEDSPIAPAAPAFPAPPADPAPGAP